MSARNRVTPFGDIVATPLRGAFTGNRGILHEGREIVRFHAGDLWITCALRFKDRWREQWLPHHFTWLFFHDEAVSFAAGHRPCAECRRAAYDDFRDAWAAAAGLATPPSAKEMNRQLHGERIVRGTHRRRLHDAPWRGLPDGVFVMHEGTPMLVLGKRIVEWSPAAGYGADHQRPTRRHTNLITPPSTVAALRAGYRPQIDRSAER
jgi:hypothetical protein